MGSVTWSDSNLIFHLPTQYRNRQCQRLCDGLTVTMVPLQLDTKLWKGQGYSLKALPTQCRNKRCQRLCDGLTVTMVRLQLDTRSWKGQGYSLKAQGMAPWPETSDNCTYSAACCFDLLWCVKMYEFRLWVICVENLRESKTVVMILLQTRIMYWFKTVWSSSNLV